MKDNQELIQSTRGKLDRSGVSLVAFFTRFFSRAVKPEVRDSVVSGDFKNLRSDFSGVLDRFEGRFFDQIRQLDEVKSAYDREKAALEELYKFRVSVETLSKVLVVLKEKQAEYETLQIRERDLLQRLTDQKQEWSTQEHVWQDRLLDLEHQERLLLKRLSASEITLEETYLTKQRAEEELERRRFEMDAAYDEKEHEYEMRRANLEETYLEKEQWWSSQDSARRVAFERQRMELEAAYSEKESLYLLQEEGRKDEFLRQQALLEVAFESRVQELEASFREREKKFEFLDEELGSKWEQKRIELEMLYAEKEQRFVMEEDRQKWIFQRQLEDKETIWHQERTHIEQAAQEKEQALIARYAQEKEAYEEQLTEIKAIGQEERAVLEQAAQEKERVLVSQYEKEKEAYEAQLTEIKAIGQQERVELEQAAQEKIQMLLSQLEIEKEAHEVQLVAMKLNAQQEHEKLEQLAQDKVQFLIAQHEAVCLDYEDKLRDSKLDWNQERTSLDLAAREKEQVLAAQYEDVLLQLKTQLKEKEILSQQAYIHLETVSQENEQKLIAQHEADLEIIRGQIKEKNKLAQESYSQLEIASQEREQVLVAKQLEERQAYEVHLKEKEEAWQRERMALEVAVLESKQAYALSQESYRSELQSSDQKIDQLESVIANKEEELQRLEAHIAQEEEWKLAFNKQHEILEATLAEKESQLSLKSEEIKLLQDRVALFSKDLADSLVQSKEQVTQQLEAQHRHALQLANEAREADRLIFEQKSEGLQSAIALKEQELQRLESLVLKEESMRDELSRSYQALELSLAHKERLHLLQSEEVSHLKSRIAQFSDDLATAISQNKEQVTQQVSAQYDHIMSLKTEERESDKALFEQKISVLEASIAWSSREMDRIESQRKVLEERLETAEDQLRKATLQAASANGSVEPLVGVKTYTFQRARLTNTSAPLSDSSPKIVRSNRLPR